MRIDPISLENQSELMKDYRNNKTKILDYFDYHPFQEATYQNRIRDLQGRSFNRKQLAETLMMINREWDAPEATYKNINRLTDENSVVVIGGQQAGLLTGPMYTINKIISIIQLARQQEEKLSIPVIPVFWIAGEDHDFAEINHIFLPEIPRMKKYQLLQRMVSKMSVSAIEKDEVYANQWIDHIFEQLQETQHTKQLYDTIKGCLDKSPTYVDFFARIIFQLFASEGVVLVDSAHAKLRELESEYFINLIEKQPEISEGVYEYEQRLKQSGYPISLGTEPGDAHLFYHYKEERILLTRNDTGEWVGKQNNVVLTTEQLVEIAKTQPELLSNNVVTRPLMQELLFPSLAFIGGPGEISYWSALKPAFRALEIKMPPVMPRLSFTFVERNVEKLLNRYAIPSGHAVNNGVIQERGNWLAGQSNPPVKIMAQQIRQSIEAVHKPLRDVARNIRADLGGLADKNLSYLFRDIDYLEDRMTKALEEKYAKELSEFDCIHTALHPNNGLQERVWNPLPWINQYGSQFIKELTEAPCSFANEHYLVYI
ncbi:putative cysteine ligase BshC [Lentibacillus populi]|uniref:Putative cysteine ligase BshC n=1 Tax=Lentibacillus populi TaxID=1827502 RepID=A0A9W5TZ19_9BACI|nr:bacillithiol biosynthesis cysteine-adding enzyme BshC [Lentibacillus populi]GGB45092.1 putative cysteine ligase BshC [Lentibacillus populi]